MKSFKLNHIIYACLLLLFLAISLTSLWICMESPWFTLIAGLGCGGFASTLVAWLIDWQNARERKKKKENLQKTILHPMKTTIYAMLLNFGRLSCELDTTISKTVPKQWDEWAEILQVNLAECNEPFFLQKAVVSLDATMNNYCNRMQELRSCKFELIYNELVKTSEYYALAEVEYYANVMRNAIATRTQLEVANQALPNLINAIQKNKNEIVRFIDLDTLQITGTSFAEHINNTDNRTWI